MLDPVDYTFPTRRQRLDHTDHDVSVLKDPDHELGMTCGRSVRNHLDHEVGIRDLFGSAFCFVRFRITVGMISPEKDTSTAVAVLCLAAL